MLIGSFFSWWYGKGLLRVAQSFGLRLNSVMDAFSVKQLLRTLFAPWRRIITYSGASLAEKFQAWGDNVLSRAIGFIVRLFVLFAAILSLLVVAAVTALELVVWPLLPLAIPAALIAGLIL